MNKTIDIRNYEILSEVKRPAQYVGGEYNSLIKDPQSVQAQMAFLFPDTYEIGMSHLGLRVLYEAINRDERFLLERSFAPQTDLEKIMRDKKLPLFTLESHRPISDFDVIGFTLQYELSYTNVLNMLDLAGLPLLAAERDDRHPLIIAGGPCVYNPEPLVDFIDLFIIGEGEEVLIELLELIAKKLPRAELLRKVADIKGIYVPQFYQVTYGNDQKIAAIQSLAGVPTRVKKRFLFDLNQAAFPSRALLPNIEVIHDRALLEVMRGCTRGCRFCQAGIIYRPLREKDLQVLLKQGQEQLSSSGYEEIGLLSLSTADYSQLEPLIDGLLKISDSCGVGVSLPSLRADAFSVDLAQKVQKVRKSGLTFAPEAGSQRMRDIINKGVTEEDMLEAAAAAFAAGWTALKLYFMIGLPEEKTEDLIAIVGLCQKVLYLGRKKRPQWVKKQLKISLGMASFVPKAHTPFQWQGQNSPQELLEKQTLLKELLRPLKAVSFSFHDIETSSLEAAFARGDRRLGQVLLKAWQKGCRFDSWHEHFRPDLWQEAFDECQIDKDFYAQTSYNYEDILPWDHLDCGVDKKWLWQEYQKALLGQKTKDCRHEGCTNCGICFNLGGENRLADSRPENRESETTD
ncbi:MAG: TIGR03960 family B12-binding radical SAM protein [Bacillota bacterium]